MLYFIVNAISGKGRGKAVAARIRELLEAKHIEFVMAFTEAKAHAVKLAREFSQKGDCTGVVAVGGDGTFSEVLNGIDLNVPLGLIASGSGNDFMRTFAPKTTLEQQLMPIIENKKRRMDFIEVNHVRCLNVAGTGFDVDILNRERKIRKYIGGAAGYYLALLITLFTLKFRTFKMNIDGKDVTEQALIISLANGKYFGGGMPVSLASETDDGVFQLQIVKKLPLYHIPYVLIRFLNGTVTKVKKFVDVYNCKQVTCAVTPEVELNIDGELSPAPEFSARICPGALTVFG